ncbi:hypothetical protein HDV00_008781 [Rhizophlyctis rosea]|nr:hypothetical protein HDV00_008781 [Rhizophlyctis rosea]
MTDTDPMPLPDQPDAPGSAPVSATSSEPFPPASLSNPTSTPKTAEKATQTEPDPPDTDLSPGATVNITLPHHHQFSIFHIQQEEEKRISGILLSSPSSDGSVVSTGNGNAAVSISLPTGGGDNRISATSIPSTKSPRSGEKGPGGGGYQRRSRNSIIIMDGQKEGVISIDFGPSPEEDVREEEDDGHAIAAPAYEEVVGGDHVSSSPVVLTSVAAGAAPPVTAIAPVTRKKSVVYVRRRESDLESVLTSIGEASEHSGSGVPAAGAIAASADVVSVVQRGRSESVATLGRDDGDEESGATVLYAEPEAESPLPPSMQIHLQPSYSQFKLPVIENSVSAVMLPPLGVAERIQNPETAAAVQSLTSTWPVFKSGFLLRKEVLPTAPSAPTTPTTPTPSPLPLPTSTTTASKPPKPRHQPSSKMLSRGIGSLLKSRKHKRSASNAGEPSTVAAVEEGGEAEGMVDWVLYFAEVRGRYLMFYSLGELEKGAAGVGKGKADGRTGTGERPGAPGRVHSSSSREALNGGKSISRFFVSIGSKRTRQIVNKKPSMDLGGRYKEERISVDKRRPSNDSLRSYASAIGGSGGGVGDLKNAPKSLVHYMPLHKATIEIIANTHGVPTSLTPSPSPSPTTPYPPTDLPPTSTSHLILTTGISTLSRIAGSGGLRTEQVLLDVVTQDELSWDQMTASSVGSVIIDKPERKREVGEWVGVVKSVSDLTPRASIDRGAEVRDDVEGIGAPSFVAGGSDVGGFGIGRLEGVEEGEEGSTVESAKSMDSMKPHVSGRAPEEEGVFPPFIAGGTAASVLHSQQQQQQVLPPPFLFGAGGSSDGRAPEYVDPVIVPRVPYHQEWSHQPQFAYQHHHQHHRPLPQPPVAFQGRYGRETTPPPMTPPRPHMVEERPPSPATSRGARMGSPSPSIEVPQYASSTPLAIPLTNSVNQSTLSLALSNTGSTMPSNLDIPRDRDGSGSSVHLMGTSSSGKSGIREKLFGGRWKKEKEKEENRGKKYVISGPSGFVRVDGAGGGSVQPFTPPVVIVDHDADKGDSRPVVKRPEDREKGARADEKKVKKKGSRSERDDVGRDVGSVGAAEKGHGVVAAFQKAKRERWDKDEKRKEREKEKERREEKGKDRRGERERERERVGGFGHGHKPSNASSVVVGGERDEGREGYRGEKEGGGHHEHRHHQHHHQQQQQQQRSSSTGLFFPFLNKSLFAHKGKDVAVLEERVYGGGKLGRSPTISSQRSTLRRRVGTGGSGVGGVGSKRVSAGTVGSGTGLTSVVAGDVPPLPTPTPTGEVPLILRKCVKLVEEIGMETEGLYRVSGSATTVQRLRALFDVDPGRVELQPPKRYSTLSSPSSVAAAGDLVPVLPRRASRLSLTDTISSSGGPTASAQQPRSSLDTLAQPRHTRRISTSSIPPVVAGALMGSSLYDNDVHVVTGVIKGYLRDGIQVGGGGRREPCCTFDLYEGFIAATQIPDWRTRMIAIQDMVHALPLDHFITLKFVCEHLKRVSEYSHVNKMSVRNLAIIFGQGLMRPPPEKDSIGRVMQDMPFQCTCVETLIDQCEWVFGPIEFEDEEGVGGVVEAVEGGIGESEGGDMAGGEAKVEPEREEWDENAGVGRETLSGGVDAVEVVEGEKEEGGGGDREIVSGDMPSVVALGPSTILPLPAQLPSWPSATSGVVAEPEEASGETMDGMDMGLRHRARLQEAKERRRGGVMSAAVYTGEGEGRNVGGAVSPVYDSFGAEFVRTASSGGEDRGWSVSAEVGGGGQGSVGGMVGHPLSRPLLPLTIPERPPPPSFGLPERPQPQVQLGGVPPSQQPYQMHHQTHQQPSYQQHQQSPTRPPIPDRPTYPPRTLPDPYTQHSVLAPVHQGRDLPSPPQQRAYHQDGSGSDAPVGVSAAMYQPFYSWGQLEVDASSGGGEGRGRGRGRPVDGERPPPAGRVGGLAASKVPRLSLHLDPEEKSFLF